MWCFFPFGEIGLKLWGQVQPQNCSQLPPTWCLVSLETVHENLNHVENETPQIGGALLDENQLSICIHDATPQAKCEPPRTLEEVWHQTSSKNWTYTSSNEGVTQVRFPNSKYLNLKMVSYFLLEMPFSMVKPKKDQQQKKEKTETVR